MEYEKAYNDLIARINEVKEKPSLCMKEKHHYNGYVETGIRDALDYITSLQQEQPFLPSDLDEAAEKEFEDYISSNFLDIDIIWARMPLTKKFGNQMFKAGAEWMAGQGVTREVEVKEDAGGYPYIDRHFELYDYDKDEPLFKAGDKVVVQIRKK